MYSSNFKDSLLVDATPSSVYQLVPIRKTENPITAYILETTSFNNKHFVVAQINEPTNFHYQYGGMTKTIKLTPPSKNTMISIIRLSPEKGVKIMNVGSLSYRSVGKLGDTSIGVNHNKIVLSYQYYTPDTDNVFTYDIKTINMKSKKITSMTIFGASKLVVTLVDNDRFYITGTAINDIVIGNLKSVFSKATNTYFASLINDMTAEWIIRDSNIMAESKISGNTTRVNDNGSIYLCGSFIGKINLDKEYESLDRISGWWGLLNINGKWCDGGTSGTTTTTRTSVNTNNHIDYTDIICSDNILHLVGTVKGSVGKFTITRNYPFYQKWGYSPTIINANSSTNMDRTVTMRKIKGNIEIGVHFDSNIILNKVKYSNKGGVGLAMLSTKLELLRYVEYGSNSIDRPTFSGENDTVIVNNISLIKNRTHGFIAIFSSI